MGCGRRDREKLASSQTGVTDDGGSRLPPRRAPPLPPLSPIEWIGSSVIHRYNRIVLSVHRTVGAFRPTADLLPPLWSLVGEVTFPVPPSLVRFPATHQPITNTDLTLACNPTHSLHHQSPIASLRPSLPPAYPPLRYPLVFPSRSLSDPAANPSLLHSPKNPTLISLSLPLPLSTFLVGN